jgi:hypothetical protein
VNFWAKGPTTVCLSASVQFSPTEKSTLSLVVTMANEYRIKPLGPQFLIIDQTGERVGVYQTEREAENGIVIRISDDLMWDSARLLVKMSVDSLMKMRNVDSRTAQYWIREAAD